MFLPPHKPAVIHQSQFATPYCGPFDLYPFPRHCAFSVSYIHMCYIQINLSPPSSFIRSHLLTYDSPAVFPVTSICYFSRIRFAASLNKKYRFTLEATARRVGSWQDKREHKKKRPDILYFSLLTLSLRKYISFQYDTFRVQVSFAFGGENNKLRSSRNVNFLQPSIFFFFCDESLQTINKMHINVLHPSPCYGVRSLTRCKIQLVKASWYFYNS